MPEYKAPLRDMRFLIDNVFDFHAHYAALGATDASPDMVSAILEEGAKFCENVLAPLNRSGDEEGCHFDKGVVTTPKGFKEAYAQYVQGGWHGVAADPAYGGQGLPQSLGLVLSEMIGSSNTSWGMYPGLTHGAMSAIHAHGSAEQKAIYLSKLTAGEWTGTMCLTEPHCGTDLGLIKTRAVPQADGSYAVSGSKIFISAGEHDLSANIIHLVLAKLPDAPAGTKVISLFIVPKFHADSGERNAVHCGSIEHKMGIKASATCVLNFDGAKGFLIGEANKGLNCMFTMMNHARLGTGMQGLCNGEASFQGAIRYANDRLQMRALTGAKAPEKAADPIIVHPDVRRMLLTMKASNEGGRAFSTYVAMQLDIAKFSEDAAARERADNLVALLTPVAKAFLSDLGLETTVLGQQIFGGHGYIREWGQEQLVRDVRITQIYEGTNGIQALDLMGRKIVGSGGAFYTLFADEIRQFTATAGAELAEFTAPLNAAVDSLDELTAWVLDRAKSNPNEIGAASVEYLHAFGYMAYAYMWARMAKAALGKEAEEGFYASKLGTARFYFARLLPRIQSLSTSVKAGSESLFLLDEALF